MYENRPLTLVKLCHKAIGVLLSKSKHVIYLFCRGFVNLFNFRDYVVKYDFAFDSRGHITYLHFKFLHTQGHLFTRVNGSRFYSYKEFFYIIPPNIFDLSIEFIGKGEIKQLHIVIHPDFKTGLYVNSTNNLNFLEMGVEQLKSQLTFFLLENENHKLRNDTIIIPEIKIGYYRQTSKIIRNKRVELKHYHPQFKEL